MIAINKDYFEALDPAGPFVDPGEDYCVAGPDSEVVTHTTGYELHEAGSVWLNGRRLRAYWYTEREGDPGHRWLTAPIPFWEHWE